MIKMLLQTHMIDEVSIPGERSRYYKIKIDGWEELFIQKLKGITAMTWRALSSPLSTSATRT